MSKPTNNEKEKIIPHVAASSGETASQIVRRHIRDKNDVITEEDIKNVKIDFSIPTEEPLTIPDKEHPKDVGKDHPYITPWDVLSE